MGLYTSAYRKCSDMIALMKESGYSQISKSEPKYAGLYSCMAGIECMRTDFDEALANIKIAYSLSKNDSNNSYKVMVLMVYWLILVGQGDIEGSEKMLVEAETLIKHNKIAPAAMALFIAAKGRTLIDQSQLEKAHEFFSENGINPDTRLSYSDDRNLLSYALLLLEESKFDEAGKLLSFLLTQAQSFSRIEDLIIIKILYAILYNTTGNKEKATISLIESLEYASRENIIMAFIHYHDKIHGLLIEVFKIQSTTTKIPKKLIEKLKLAIERREKSKETYLLEGISTRELDTLRLIAKDLSNQEIADRLFVSVNTVKTHLKNIYLKLGVDSRAKAVIKAKELQLI